MKKFISLLLCAAICVLGLGGCTQARSKPLAEVYSELQEINNMPEMSLMEDELITAVFGFDTASFDEYIFAEASDPSVNADAIILIKLKNPDELTSVCDTLDVYLSSVKDNTQSYSPVNYAKASAASVSVIGNDFVYLVITTDYYQAVQIIQNSVKAIKSPVQTRSDAS